MTDIFTATASFVTIEGFFFHLAHYVPSLKSDQFGKNHTFPDNKSFSLFLFPYVDSMKESCYVYFITSFIQQTM